MAALETELREALNDQVKWELYSSYLYLSMSSYFSSIDLPGFAHWMRVQAQEELMHAMKIYDYIIERGSRATLLAIDQPPYEWESPLNVAEEVYQHEQKVTGMITRLMDMATSKKDYAAMAMLQWFVEEQVEEEANSNEIVQKVKMVSGEGGKGALYMLDRELALRPPKIQKVPKGE